MTITAAELIAQMNADPAAHAGRERALRHRDESRRAYDQAAAPLVSHLAAAGMQAQTLEQLRASHETAAVPVLLSWIGRTEYAPLQQDILATLGERWTGRRGVEGLFAIYETTDPGADREGGARWQAAAALSRVVAEQDLDRLLRLINSTDGGGDRTPLVLALGRMKKSRARVLPVLRTLLDTLDTRAVALKALGRLKAVQYRDAIEPYRNDAEPFVREKARCALRAIDRHVST